MPPRIILEQEWNGTSLEEDDRGEVAILSANDHVDIEFTVALTPQWTAPQTPPGFTHGLWEYDVFEIFFARPDGTYLEIEVGPAGHFLVYEFASYRKAVDTNPRPLQYSYTVSGETWKGEFIVPLGWLCIPLEQCRVNVYQIRTTEKARQYLAWRSLPDIAPDFHKTECFEALPV